MAKKIDPVKAKAKRQKKIAIVGGVVLLALLAFQLPRTMKMLKSPGNVTTSSSTTTSSTSTTPGSTPLAPPTLDGGSSTDAGAGGTGTGSAVATSSDGVRDPDTPLPADAGQLVSFSRFKSKDPFLQQVTPCGQPTCDTGSSPSSGAVTSTSQPAAVTSGGGNSTSAGRSKPAPTKIASVQPAAPVAPVSSAVISINGQPETVTVGKTFPAADPVFVLTKATRAYVMVSISGGALQSGAGAVKVAKGKSVTLRNTADGTQYVLKLVSTA
jgi:hypothetical protein